MAITFINEPAGIYPAYNDSFISFTSDQVGNNKAEIIVYPTSIFPQVFTIYPNADGVYLFNLKEPVKVIFNENGFKDSNYFTDGFYKDTDGLYLAQLIQIKVLGGGEDTIQKTYEFYKGVKQIGEPISSNPFQLLTHSKNGVDHYLTYVEGYPFSFDIQKVVFEAGKVLTIKNLNSGLDTGDIPVTKTGAFRINIDKGDGGNWTSENYLPLNNGLNRLEIHENGVFKSNLFLKKKNKCEGVYLKWFNRQGGFSYALFEEYFRQGISGKSQGEIQNNDFLNIGENVSDFKSIGQEASSSMVIRLKYDAKEYENLRDLFTSPLVQLYTSNCENVEGTFIDVSVAGSLGYANKRGNNELSLTVRMPDLITAKL